MPKKSREPQRRLNPVMKDVVRAEVLKLLDADIIYLIFENPLVHLCCAKEVCNHGSSKLEK